MKTRRCFSIVPFLQIMRCIFPRAHAPARAINIIVHVFLLLLRPVKKICRVTYLFSSVLRKNFQEKSKKSRVKVGV